MLSRIPPVRRSGALAVAVFIVGVGIGALIIALSDPAHAPRVVVKHVRSSALTGATTTTTSFTATTSTTPVPATTPAQPRLEPPLGSTVPAGAAASFAALESQLDGSVGLAAAPLGQGPVQSFGQFQTAHAWSTSKVPVLVTLLRDDENDGEPLNPEERTDATLALEQSDNAAIEALFSILEQIHGGLVPASAAVQQELRTAGDEGTTINTAPNDEGFTTYGQTLWPVADEVIFYRALARGCLLDPQDTAYVLALMRSVIPSQRWGAGAAGYSAAVPLAFKGGWGPDSNGDYQVRQTAIVGSGNRGYVVSMLARPASGAFADGTALITALATWARQNLDLNAARPPAQCQSSR